MVTVQKIFMAFLISLCCPIYLFSQQDSSLTIADLYQMSIDDLLQLKIKSPTSYTNLKILHTPAAVTTITKEDIQKTPARNIYDLIEVYVPGSICLNHQLGPRLGIRGIISDRNYKNLVLINGRSVNDKTKFGAEAELKTWDFNDIEKIEVVSGLGSVAQGPGAVSGIINIVTKQAKERNKLSAQGEYNPMYQMAGGNVSYSTTHKNIDLFSYFGFYSAEGYENPDYFAPNPAKVSRFYGKAATDTFYIPSYISSSKLSPLLKAHLSLNYKDRWKVWARYSKTGGFYEVNQPQQLEDQLAIVNIENSTNISPKIRLNSRISASSQSYKSHKLMNHGRFYGSDLPSNTFAEHDIRLHSVLNYEPNKNYEFAIGLEMNENILRPAWGTPNNKFLFWERTNFISDSNSVFVLRNEDGTIRNIANLEFIGNGWETLMYSVFGEGKLHFFNKLTFLLSGRMDKHSWTDFMFSPRLAIIYDINSKSNFKLLTQQSVRMLTAPILYLSDKNNENIEPEIVQSIELNYNKVNSNSVFFIHSFYNNVNIVGYTGNSYSTGNIGNIDIAGIEAGIKYKAKKFSGGINHSFVKQLKFKMFDNIKDGRHTQGISFSDYYYNNFKYAIDNGNDIGLELQGYGNDLNNWSNHQSKIFANWHITKNITLHINSQLLYGMKGAENELIVYQNAYEAVNTSSLNNEQLVYFNQIKDEFLTIKKDVEHSGAHGFQSRFNASVNYQLKIQHSDLFIGAYMQNIPVFGTPKRLTLNSGNNTFYPVWMRHVEEPFSIGLRLKIDVRPVN